MAPALRFNQLRFQIAVERGLCQLGSVAALGEGLQPKIEANIGIPACPPGAGKVAKPLAFDLADEADVLVFTTKRRGKVLSQPHLDRLRAIFESVWADFQTELRAFNGESDHIHRLVHYPPKVQLSELVNSLKGVSSQRLKQRFPEIAPLWSVRKSQGVLWLPSDFVGPVGGAPLTILPQYIESQGRG